MRLPKWNKNKIIMPTASTFGIKNSTKLINNYNGGMDYYRNFKKIPKKPRLDSNLKQSKNYTINKRNFRVDLNKKNQKLKPLSKKIVNIDNYKINNTHKNYKDDLSDLEINNYESEQKNKEKFEENTQEKADIKNINLIKYFINLDDINKIEFFLKLKIIDLSNYDESYDILYLKINEKEILFLKKMIFKSINLLNYEFQKMTHKKHFTNYKKKIYENMIINLDYLEEIKDKLKGEFMFVENYYLNNDN